MRRKARLCRTEMGPLVGEREELRVLAEALGHRELVDEPVVVRDLLAIGGPARHRGLDARLGEMLADSQAFPLRVARPVSHFRQVVRLLGRYFVVRDQYGLPPAAVLPVEPHHRVGGGPRAAEEVGDDCVRVVLHKEPKGVLDRVQRLRKREVPPRQEGLEDSGAVVLGAVGAEFPLGRRRLACLAFVDGFDRAVLVPADDRGNAVLDVGDGSGLEVLNDVLLGLVGALAGPRVALGEPGSERRRDRRPVHLRPVWPHWEHSHTALYLRRAVPGDVVRQRLAYAGDPARLDVDVDGIELGPAALLGAACRGKVAPPEGLPVETHCLAGGVDARGEDLLLPEHEHEQVLIRPGELVLPSHPLRVDDRGDHLDLGFRKCLLQQQAQPEVLLLVDGDDERAPAGVQKQRRHPQPPFHHGKPLGVAVEVLVLHVVVVILPVPAPSSCKAGRCKSRRPSPGE